MSYKNTFCVLCMLVVSIAISKPIQGQTIGLIANEAGAMDGYTLYKPLGGTSTYLVDNCGRLVHEWKSVYTPGNSEYLLDNGILIRTATASGVINTSITGLGGGQRVQAVNWNGTVLWDFVYNTATNRMHHDVAPMPNGNILILAWEQILLQDVLDAGRDPSLIPDNVIWSEEIIEVNPFTGQIVWEWNFWDHLIQDFDSTKQNYGVVADHPELMDVNFTGIEGPGADWVHANSIDYNPTLDQIVLNSRSFSEYYIIDHSTTTAEAAGSTGGNSGRGGDFLYRWGNPRAYDQGTVADQKLFGAHDAYWIPEGYPDEGKIMVFNNGLGRPGGLYSSVEIVDPPLIDSTGTYAYSPGTAYAPALPEWIYTSDPVTDFYSFFISGARRLPNGNTLICEGSHGRFFEIDTADNIVWEYINPVSAAGPLSQGDPVPSNGVFNTNLAFRATKLAADHPGLAGQNLTPKAPLEFNYVHPYICAGDTLLTCDAPQNNNSIVNGAKSATLTWDPVPGVTGYQITGGQTGLPPIQPINVGLQTSFTVGILSPSTQYYWRVRAICDNSGTLFSPYSNNDLFTTPALCPQVTGLTETNITETSVILHWQLASGATKYQIAGAAMGGPIVTFTINDSAQNSLTVAGLMPDFTYQWTIRSFCPGSGLSPYAPARSFTTLLSGTPKLAGNQEGTLPLSNSVNIYPNPANHILNIELTNPLSYGSTIELYNLAGVRLIEQQLSEGEQALQLDVSDLPRGVYTFRLNSSEFSSVSSVVIQ